MRGKRCSWVEMMAIRQALSAGERGDQKRLELMRCVGKNTVSAWKAACDVRDAIEGKVPISELSNIQPSHATELGQHFRKRSPEWDESTKEDIKEWVLRCDEDELTVEQLRKELKDEYRQQSVEKAGKAKLPK